MLASVTDGVAELTSKRPERMNAYTAEMGQELIRLFREYDGDDNVRGAFIDRAAEPFGEFVDDTFTVPDHRPDDPEQVPVALL